MKKDQYKVVIVGFAHVHINDVAKHFYEHPRIDLAAAADVPPRVPELKPGAIYTREWNIDYCCKNYNMKKYDDWKVMLDEEKPDLCVVNSENFYHVEITEECAKRGIGVSIEKPMATTMSDAMKMARIVKTYNTFCTYSKIVLKCTQECTCTIVEVETLGDNGLLPFVYAINNNVVAKAP